MRLSGVRRATMAAGLATAAALALSACSAGQVAETALKKPSNSGVNADTADSTVAIRNLQVFYNGPEGYRAGESAPIEVAIYNRTTQQLIVTISSTPAAAAGGQIVSARQVGLTGGSAAAPASSESAAPEPSGSRPPATPDTETPDNIPSPDASDSAAPALPPPAPVTQPLQPARIIIEPMGSASFLPGDQEMLVAAGLSDKLAPGSAVNLTFQFSNGAAPLMLRAPVGVPLSPAPRGSAVTGENEESEGGEG